MTQQLVSDLAEMIKLPLDDPIYHEKMKQVLGHRMIEAVGGFVLGAVLTVGVAFILGIF